MATSAVTLGSLLNEVLIRPEISRAAIITSAPTGNPALNALDAKLARELLIIQYDNHTGLDEVAARHSGLFDAIITDPFHTYEASVRCLEVCLRLLRPGGILLCHDCLPPPDYITADVVDEENWTVWGRWSGFTFAAFRDVMTARGADWCTLDADFGIGVAVIPPDSQPEPAMDLPPLTPEAERDYETRYRADPFTLMRTVRADQWEQVLDGLSRGTDLTPMKAVFTTWERLLPPSRTEGRLYRLVRRVSLGREKGWTTPTSSATFRSAGAD